MVREMKQKLNEADEDELDQILENVAGEKIRSQIQSMKALEEGEKAVLNSYSEGMNEVAIFGGEESTSDTPDH